MKHLSTGFLIVATVAAIASARPTVGRADGASPAPVASSTGIAALVVDTKDFAFVPATLSVAAGETVTFENSDSVAHTVTATDKAFDSGNMDPGTRWTHVFKTPGTYTYVCSYHTYMTGKIVVK